MRACRSRGAVRLEIGLAVGRRDVRPPSSRNRPEIHVAACAQRQPFNSVEASESPARAGARAAARRLRQVTEAVGQVFELALRDEVSFAAPNGGGSIVLASSAAVSVGM